MTDWPLDRRQRRALNRRLDQLRQVDHKQAIDGSLVVKIKGPGLYKTKVRGNLQLRPRLCFGPLDGEIEVITLLQRAQKKGNKPDPPRAESAARSLAKIAEIKADPQQCRTQIGE